MTLSRSHSGERGGGGEDRAHDDDILGIPGDSAKDAEKQFVQNLRNNCGMMMMTSKRTNMTVSQVPRVLANAREQLSMFLFPLMTV